MSTGTALAIVKAAKDKGALVFANMENLETQVELYRTEVTQITFTEKDFHTISGKKMPNKAATDRIGEACGIQFIQKACRVTTETHDDELCGGKHTIYRAEAQGRTRNPDGSWRESTVDEYEFDPVLRAMLDKNVTEINSQTKPMVAKAILEYTKVARQRAATGARLRVIRQLTGMPAAFETAEALKPMVFTRVVQNTSYILGTPEGRLMANAQALGVDMSSMFGGRKMLDESPAAHQETDYSTMRSANETPPENIASAMAAEAAASNEPEFPDEPTGPGSEKEDLLTEKGILIEQIMNSYKDALDVVSKNGKNPYKMAQEELDNPNATVESRDSMINRLYEWLKNKGVKV